MMESVCKECESVFYAGKRIIDGYCWECIDERVRSGEWTVEDERRHCGGF